MTKKSKFLAELKKESNIKKFGVSKVNLTLVSEVTDAIQRGNVIVDFAPASIQETNEFIREYENARQKLEGKYDALQTFESDISKIQDDITSAMISLDAMASEIGIDVDSIPEYRNASNMFDRLDDISVDVSDTLSEIPVV
jgi:hypothetical protein